MERIFGTLNIAISFPATGRNCPAHERGERSVKTAVSGGKIVTARRWNFDLSGAPHFVGERAVR
jgi:metal-sulfur cluster biosynthetic enzyme